MGRVERTLMNGEIAAVTEDDGVRVLSFSVVADLAGRVFRGQRALGVRDHLRLYIKSD
jgi:hypothetical protein